MVDASLDGGIPVAYAKLELYGDQVEELYKNAYRGDSTSKEKLFRIMREREFSIEAPLIIKTLSLISRGYISIENKKIYYKGKLIDGGIDITGEAEG
jgi:hypothetical protein